MIWPYFVYRMYGYGEDWELLYVGCSHNPLIRITTHRRKHWGHRFVCYRLTEYAERREAEQAERAAIFAEQPEFNTLWKTPNSGRPAGSGRPAREPART